MGAGDHHQRRVRQMKARAAMYTVVGCLVVAAAAAKTTSQSWFEAYTSGARTMALRGTASYGTVGSERTGAFVVTLGAGAPEGAVLFTRSGGGALTPGVYRVDEDPAHGVQALVITGPATRPTGAYRGRSGTLTIGGTREGLLDGYFTIDAVAFAAATPGDEGQQVRVRGAFTATRTR